MRPEAVCTLRRTGNDLFSDAAVVLNPDFEVIMFSFPYACPNNATLRHKPVI
jgi:hypothetical protein